MDFVVVHYADGTVRDTIMKFPSGGSFSFGRGQPQIKLYSAEPLWALTDDMRMLYGVNDDYRIGIHADGQLERMFSKPFTPRPVTEGDKDAIMGFIEDQALRAGASATGLARLRSMISFGEHIPAFANIQLGPMGSIWVQHIRSLENLSAEERESFNVLEEMGAPDWDVFDAEGRFLGAVRMPDRFAPRVFVDDLLYGVWRDELDVQYVVRLRIEGLST